MKYLMLLYADSRMPEPGTPEARRLFDDGPRPGRR